MKGILAGSRAKKAYGLNSISYPLGGAEIPLKNWEQQIPSGLAGQSAGHSVLPESN